MKLPIWTFSILFLFLGACKKDCNPTNIPITITTLTEDFVDETQYLMQLRLAFGKTVANALAFEGFRTYILEKSKLNTDNFFNEILFATYQNDEITPNVTMKNFLENAIDEEVRTLFGASFLDKVLKDDPLVTVKIPDLFYQFDWKVEEYAPMVYVKTVVPLPDEEGFSANMAYHYGGYNEYVPDWTIPKHFCLVVKYSEDYFLLDIEKGINEKGISMEELVPQAMRCWEELKPTLKSLGISLNHDGEELQLIKKRVLFDTQINVCEQNFNMVNPCNGACSRDCADNLNDLDNVLATVSFSDGVWAQILNPSYVFNENVHTLYTFFVEPENIHNQIAVTGFRLREYFVNYQPKITVTTEEHCTNDNRHVDIPTLTLEDYRFKKEEIKGVSVRASFWKGWPNLDTSRSIGVNIAQLKYSDVVVNNFVPYYEGAIGGSTVFASDVINGSASDLYYCADNSTIYDLGDMTLRVIF